MSHRTSQQITDRNREAKLKTLRQQREVLELAVRLGKTVSLPTEVESILGLLNELRVLVKKLTKAREAEKKTWAAYVKHFFPVSVTEKKLSRRAKPAKRT